MTPGASTEAAVGWLGQPWAGALVQLLADPAADLDAARVPGWPAWAPIDAALSDPWIRAKLGRWLVGPDGASAGEIIGCCAEPRVRLAIIPAADAVGLMALVGAWIDADRLAALLRRSDIDGVRAAIGAEAFDFALAHGRLLPRPSLALAAALEATLPLGEPVAFDRILRRGGRVFGIALGALPSGFATRLRLRRPAALWAEITAHCENRGEAAALAEDAFSAIRRVARAAALPWSTWFA
jgi:hypothetical protein